MLLGATGIKAARKYVGEINPCRGVFQWSQTKVCLRAAVH